MPSRSLLRFLTSPPLPNTGSLARDLLASERTFLAWTRTGLGFIALGVALEKVEAFAALSPALLHLQDSKTRLAAGILVATGAGTVVHGTTRYFGTLSLLKVCSNFSNDGIEKRYLTARYLVGGKVQAKYWGCELDGDGVDWDSCRRDSAGGWKRRGRRA